MRNNIFLLVLIFGLCYTVLGQDSAASLDSADSSDSANSSNSSNDDEGENSDYFYPCKNSEDIVCVRTFFMRSFRCIGMAFDDRQPVYRRRQTAYMPKANLTMITTGDVITFFGSKIEKLYVNKRTNNLIISVAFKKLKIESAYVYYLFHQRGKEAVMAGDSVNVTYVPTLTAVIPIGHGLNMKGASVHAYNHDANPTYEMGPNLAESSNPVVANAMAAISSNLPTVVQEVFLTEAYNLFLAYMQSQVCFFFIPLST